MSGAKLKPTAGQLEFLDWEFGVFFHFGIRSFFMGHKDWDGREMPCSAFNPEELDCEQWIREARDAGARYAILVTKHHDGFANWPSKYTDYSVAHTPWKGGHGDVVRQYVDACRKLGVKVGLYYSPAQWGGKVSFREGREYDDYFINQIGELLTNYGRIDYLWFDGCGSADHKYDTGRIVAAIRGMQPQILIFSMWDPDTRWIGNEDGYADMPNHNVVPYQAEGTREPARPRFLPAECDFKMRSTWFDCEPNEHTIKTTEELMGIYEMSVGRGANFLLNIGPDARGLLPAADVLRLREFGAELRRRYGHPIEAFCAMERTGEGTYAIRAQGDRAQHGEEGGLPLVNRVMLCEDLTEGEAIEEFRLYAALPGYRSQRVCVYRGDTVGHKAICAFPAIRTGELTVEIIRQNGACALRDMKAYLA